MPRHSALALFTPIFLTAISGTALAQDLTPHAVEQRARQFEKECAKILSPGQKLESREEDWVQVIARDGAAKILLLDAKKTRCFENDHAICGTGGCPVVLYRVSGKQVRKLYDKNVLEWRVTEHENKKYFHADVHGGHCGQPGNAACETFVDLSSGAITTRQPD
ncbi:MAG: hypothetical protein ACRCTD_14945 [Beijerinckiaceae bacterium]